ncbi:hypothetical protein LEP48_18100 [Isoptericola sp. NEAU-Y5]|uniref:PKD domain-containing protein n=1 Tax=Isoptericola luteus TaxID=2879484 RepID=A0ABS7ZJQ6_9MICO|nr:hypothetical protein [Isoptericola sp. NEAU-Y5]MCA5894869.1 hypothetical protein [Isoptericola sp. NEAU-Y5]MCA5895245.1 hypothetical protein [Isoptericola sp. NEAU-Y5]
MQLNDTNYLQDIVDAPGACDAGEAGFMADPDCDEYWLAPLWVQRVRDDGGYGAPEQLSDGQCVTPADLAVEAAREFAVMKVPTPPVTVQGGEPMLVNVHYPAYTTAEPQELEAVLLDVPVVIRADPAQFVWDFDDPYSAGGGTLTTTEPGRAWSEGDPLPDASWVGHTYSRLGEPGTDVGTAVDAEGDVYRSGIEVSLTTTWRGSFRIQGSSTWTAIEGTITTTSTTAPATVTEARTRLVCEDLHGNDVC